MNKLKLFIENFLVYGLGGVVGKMIPLIMVPIITRIMPNTGYYGINDLSNTIVQFGSAIAIIGMYDAMYRLFFEKEEEEYKKSVCSTAFVFTLITSSIVFVVMVLLRNVIAQYFLGDSNYAYVVYISAIATLVGSTNSIISAPTRMQNKRKIFLVTNMISPIIAYSISIPLLLNGHYIIALPLAGVISSVTLELLFGALNHRWFSLKLFDKQLLKQLLVIAVPLFPNFLFYWLFNAFDKIAITNLMGVDAAGVYAAGSKLGQCSQLIYTAFAGGWQYFAFSTMKEKNQVEANSLVFEYLGAISYAIVSFVFAFSYIIFKWVFPNEYLQGYTVGPYLFFAPLVQMLYQVADNQFLVIKKTWPTMIIFAAGAILNVFLNYVLIPIMGIEGAAVATLIGYAVALLATMILLIKLELMCISRRFICCSVGMVIYIVIWRMWFSKSMLVGSAMAMLLLGAIVWLYREELGMLKKAIKDKNR